MTIKAVGHTIAILIFTGFTFLPSNAENSPAKSIVSQGVSFVKPGAAVDLTQDYDGKTRKGELETVTLTLNHIYEAGYLTVSLLPPPNMQIMSDMTPHTIKLEAGSVFTLPVRFSSMVDGAYTIGVETVYESLEGYQSRRVLSVPITIGNQTKETQKSSKPVAVQVTTKGIIALPAREVIK